MSDINNFAQYDEVLTSILEKEKSIIGFLSTIFNFLARRTDFYYIPEGPNENMGFPPGVAEELVVKILQKCDPKNFKGPQTKKSTDINDEIMCSTVAQEVDVIADEDTELLEVKENPEQSNNNSSVLPQKDDNYTVNEEGTCSIQNPATPVIHVQKDSDTYNGAERDKYSWAQTIRELDITIKLPPEIKSSKDLKVTINPADIFVACRSGEIIIKDKLSYKIKAIDSIWSICEGKLLIHLDKVQERWWNKFLDSEEPIDLSMIDATRSLYELPDDHIAKVREIQFNQEQKMKGLPTSDKLHNIEVLKKAWEAEGSPFKGIKFDPSILGNK